MQSYENRSHAGKLLANTLAPYANHQDTIILALPRGGVPVAYEIASALHLPLDVFIVRKLGVPMQPELAFGAIASGNIVYLNQDIINHYQLTEKAIQKVQQAEITELNRRLLMYRGNCDYSYLTNKIVILIDDGIATGATMQVAINAIKNLHAKEIILALPVGALDACLALAKQVSKLICPLQIKNFAAVGQWYDDFNQTSDKEVQALLTANAKLFGKLSS